VNLLEWLGYPAWTNGRPSPWIRGLFQQEKRKPAITFLLLIGLFNADAFEAASTNECVDTGLCRKPIEVSDWKANLRQLLAIHSFRLATVARKAGVSQDIVVAEARRQAIRVPLSQRKATSLGQERIESVRADLRAGVLKKEVQEKHRVSRWDILLIELDAPRVNDAQRSAIAIKRRDRHRIKVLDRSKAAAFVNWKADLPRLLTMYSFKLETLARRIGVRTCTVAAEARRQGIRVPLSQRMAEKLGQEKLIGIRCDLRAGLPKKEVQKKHRASSWDILWIELDTSAAERSAARSAAAVRKRDAHRFRVLDAIARVPNISRSRVREMWPETYGSMLRSDREWFDKALPQQRPWATPRANRVDRAQLDSALAENLEASSGN